MHFKQMFYKSFAFTTLITVNNDNKRNSKLQLRSEYI